MFGFGFCHGRGRRSGRGASAALAAIAMLPALIASDASASGDDYPYRHATNCASQFGKYSWCVDENGGGGFTDAEQYSAWGFAYRNCTDFVAWRMNKTNGVTFTNWMGGGRWSHAYNWDDNARSLGYPVNGTPAVGAIAQTDGAAGSFGHVAWVSAVNSNGTVTIEDYNNAGTGLYGVRTVAASTYRYIHVKDLSASAPPFGNFDEVASAAPGMVRVRGWAIDNDAKSTPLAVHLYVGGPAGSGAEVHGITANVRRDDVGAAYPGTGVSHGFDATFAIGPEGSQQVCAYAIDVGGTDNTHLGCKTVYIADPDPFGSLDSAAGTASTVRVRGWTIDPNDHNARLRIHVYVGGAAGTAGAEGHDIGPAALRRDDVASAYPAGGPLHGFDEVVATAKRGVQQVCVYAINIGAGHNQLLSCASVDLSAGAPFADGTFVSHGGYVYRIAGGAPVYVSAWSAFGGPQPTTSLSDAEFAALPAHPADGSFVSEANGGHVYRIVGGAPVYVSTWNAFSGRQPTTAVDMASITNAGKAAPWNRLRFRPAEGSLLRGTQDSSLWRVVGGAPYAYSGAFAGRLVGMDRAAITNAGLSSPWNHLDAPKDAGVWFGSNNLSTPASVVSFRWGDGKPQVLSCDIDGDGRSGPVAVTGASWKIAGSETPFSPASRTPTVTYGRPGDVAVCGDWDGDGRDGLGVYKPAEGRWYLRNSATSGVGDITFVYGGRAGDRPVVGDWDRDGRDEPGIFRNGTWFLGNVNGSVVSTAYSSMYGTTGDTPLVGDWDGDGRDGIGVRRSSTRRFYVRNGPTAGSTITSAVWGIESDLAIAGDWNGDRRDGIGVVREQPVA